MKTEDNKMKEFIKMAKYLNNEMNEKEKNEFEIKLENNSEMKKMYTLLHQSWNSISHISEANVDVDHAWEKVCNRIQNDGGVIPVRKKLYVPKYLQIAASIVLIIGIGIGVYKAVTGLSKDMHTLTTKEEQQELRLPDGSSVLLNAHSTCMYSDKFIGNTRNVKLQGEAYFDIVNDQAKPFIINANKAIVTVLGTSFNVLCKKDNSTEVFVEKGKIQLAAQNNENITLTPGYIGKLEKNTLSMTENTDINYLAWKTRKLEFRNNNLKYVVATLEHTYGVRIEITNPEIYSKTYTGTHPDQSLTHILDVLASTFTISVKKVGDKYIIY